MTDISDLREGDVIEVVMRMRCGVDAARDRRVGYYTFPYLFDVAERVTVVRPEIIPGQPYVDADGKLYIGKSGGRVVHVNDEGIGIYYHASKPEHRPLPHGLRPAKVMPADLPEKCGTCGHQHAGPELGGICVGCACGGLS